MPNAKIAKPFFRFTADRTADKLPGFTSLNISILYDTFSPAVHQMGFMPVMRYKEMWGFIACDNTAQPQYVLKADWHILGGLVVQTRYMDVSGKTLATESYQTDQTFKVSSAVITGVGMPAAGDFLGKPIGLTEEGRPVPCDSGIQTRAFRF